MERNHTTNITTRRSLLEHDMTPTLAYPRKAETLQRRDRLSA
jgi:hypothetical protein